MATQTRLGHEVGFTPNTPSNGANTRALSAANTWIAYGFVPSESKTVSKIKVFTSAATGVLTAAGISGTVYSDTGGTGPNAVIEARTSYTPDPPTAGNWQEFTGFTGTSALTAGVQYWFVVRNNVGTPASNFPTYSYGDANTGCAPTFGSGIAYGWHVRISTDGGATWAASTAANVCGIRIEYSDGSFDGTPFQAFGSTAAASSVFANREVGNVFNWFANSSMKVRGIAFYVSKTGTPTQALRFRLYNGTSLFSGGTTNTVAVANVSANMWIAAYFPAAITIPAGTTSVRAVISEVSQSDTSANCFRPFEYTIDNDANSRALMPFDGTCFKTTTADSTATPPVFTDTNTAIVPFALIPDTTGEFASAGSAGMLYVPTLEGI
jgi:hypothetical protein